MYPKVALTISVALLTSECVTVSRLEIKRLRKFSTIALRKSVYCSFFLIPLKRFPLCKLKERVLTLIDTCFEIASLSELRLADRQRVQHARESCAHS